MSIALLLSAYVGVEDKGEDFSSVNEQIESTTDELKNSTDNSLDTEKEKLSKFVINFYNIVNKPDADKFKELIGDNGLYSISFFDDGRDPNKSIFELKKDIRDDLFLISSQSGKAGISLCGGNFSIKINEVYFNEISITDNPLLTIDWTVKDENVINSKLQDILEGCQLLILENNENVPQVFKLSDKKYALSYSSINENELQEFYGYWIIFEENNQGYFINAIIEMQ